MCVERYFIHPLWEIQVSSSSHGGRSPPQSDKHLINKKIWASWGRRGGSAPSCTEHTYSQTSRACCPGAHPGIYRYLSGLHHYADQLAGWLWSSEVPPPPISLVLVVFRRRQSLLLQSLKASTRSCPLQDFKTQLEFQLELFKSSRSTKLFWEYGNESSHR